MISLVSRLFTLLSYNVRKINAGLIDSLDFMSLLLIILIEVGKVNRARINILNLLRFYDIVKLLHMILKILYSRLCFINGSINISGYLVIRY